MITIAVYRVLADGTHVRVLPRTTFAPRDPERLPPPLSFPPCRCQRCLGSPAEPLAVPGPLPAADPPEPGRPPQPAGSQGPPRPAGPTGSRDRAVIDADG